LRSGGGIEDWESRADSDDIGNSVDASPRYWESSQTRQCKAGRRIGGQTLGSVGGRGVWTAGTEVPTVTVLAAMLRSLGASVLCGAVDFAGVP
jgi:hypothetical protein